MTTLLKDHMGISVTGVYIKTAENVEVDVLTRCLTGSYKKPMACEHQHGKHSCTTTQQSDKFHGCILCRHSEITERHPINHSITQLTYFTSCDLASLTDLPMLYNATTAVKQKSIKTTEQSIAEKNTKMYFAWQQNADINIWSSAPLTFCISPLITFILALHACSQQRNHTTNFNYQLWTKQHQLRTKQVFYNYYWLNSILG